MPPAVPSAPADPDPDLIRRAQAGDEAAFGALMRAHYEHVFRLVYSVVRHEHDARDICQEVWLTVWKQLANFRGESKFTTWLHPIAVRRAIDLRRKQSRWFDRFIPFAAEGDDAESAPERFAAAPEAVAADDIREETDRAERAARFREALESLPPKHRAVLALREVEGLSYEEIAAATAIPVGTVMSRLYHARRLLAKKLGAQP